MRSKCKRMEYWVLVVVVLLAISGSNGFTQDNLLKAEDVRQEAQVGAYHQDADGNQSYVREYDGRDFDFLGMELVDIYGYKGSQQYWFNARDLFVGDESIDFGIARGNFIRFSGWTNALTHRLGRIPAANPWVASQLSALDPAPAPPVEGVTWDTFRDLSPDNNFVLNRRVNQLSFYMNADPRARLGLTAGWWQEDEDGRRQFLFRAREARAGVIDNRQRGAVGIPINQKTNEGTAGLDLKIGKGTVLNYRYVNTKFNDNRSGIASGSDLDFLPLNSLTRIGSDTRSHVLKARGTVSDRLLFTGVHINKERINSRNDIPAGFANAGEILNKRTNIDSTNLAMLYRATDSLSFTGRWRRLDMENLVPPVFTLANPVDPANESLSRDLNSLQLEGVYTGVPHMYIRFGYENRDLDRTAGTLQPGNDDLVLPATGLSTDWNIWRASVRYHPILGLNLSANYEDWSGTNSGYTGAPNGRSRTNINATYMLRDNMAVYGDISRWEESNNQVRVTGAIPDQATTPEEEEIRELAAGQGYRSEFTTANIGTWLAVNNKLTLDANLGSVHLNSHATWIFGHDPAFPPHLPAGFVPFRSENTQWSLGANYAANRRTRLYGRFFQANSTGASLVEPDNFAGLGPQWSPFNINQNRWTLGVIYNLPRQERLNFDFSITKWEDEIDQNNTGTYSLWRLAWVKQY